MARQSTGKEIQEDTLEELKAMRADVSTYWLKMEKYHHKVLGSLSGRSDDRYIIKELFKAMTILIGAIVAMAGLIRLAG